MYYVNNATELRKATNTENEYLINNPSVQRSLVFSTDVIFLLVYLGQLLQEFQTEKVR